MEELGDWIDHQVFYPLSECWIAYFTEHKMEIPAELNELLQDRQTMVDKLIKSKVLGSYKNGANAAAKAAGIMGQFKRSKGQGRESKGRGRKEHDLEF